MTAQIVGGLTLTTANVAGGIMVFKDPPGHGPLAFIGEALAFVVVVVAAALVPGGAATGSSRPGRHRPHLA
jgi:hypothetical protein